MVGEHVKDCRIRSYKFSFIKLLIVVLEESFTDPVKPDNILYFGVIITELNSHRLLGNRPGECIVRLFNIGNDPVDVIRIHVIPVVTKLIKDIHQQQYAARDTDSQPGDVYSAVGFVFPDRTEGNNDQVLKHGWSLSEL